MKKILIILCLLAGVAVAGLIIFRNESQQSVPDSVQAENVIVGFGARLKNVPLTAEPAVLSATLQKEYGPYVAPALLARWMDDPAHAPGRETSSPWPERIEVTEIRTAGAYYEAVGNVVLMTSAELVSGGDAGRTPVYLTLAHLGGRWLIAEYQTSME